MALEKAEAAAALGAPEGAAILAGDTVVASAFSSPMRRE
ncbi:MAG: hypothetical protein MK030_06655 [SAR116 cluster bacterium]|nr:hypothetical protein [SAR116 cluster bacterium]